MPYLTLPLPPNMQPFYSTTVMSQLIKTCEELVEAVELTSNRGGLSEGGTAAKAAAAAAEAAESAVAVAARGGKCTSTRGRGSNHASN